MLRHGETIRKVGDVGLEAGEEYHTITVEVTTSGGIDKLLKLSESDASWLVARLSDALSERPKDTRGATFRASLRAGAKWYLPKKAA